MNDNRGGRFRSYFWLLAGAWSACIAASLLWNLHRHRLHVDEMVRTVAQIIFENDVLYRHWVAQQGGLYARVSPATPPNPYLAVPDRDVTTTAGQRLTLLNPAYLARLVNESAGAAGGSRGHITSLRPLRPENAPDAWEAAALRSFEQGVTETAGLEEMADGGHFRLMRPFMTEQSCLKCHAAQGYKVGDVRGGISVSVPMAPLWASEGQATIHLFLAHLGLWSIGMIGIGFFWRSLTREVSARREADERLRRLNAELEERVARQTAEIRAANATLEQRVAERTAEIEAASAELRQEVADRKRAEEALRESEQRLVGVLESMPDAFVSFDRDMRYTYVNANAERLQGARREDLLGKDVRAVYPDAESYKTISQYERVVQEQRPATLTSYHAGFDRWVEVRVFPTPDGVSVFFKDVSAQMKAEEDLRASLAEKEVLLKEIHHRVKNNMQVISSLVALQADQSSDPALHAALLDVSHRVRSMALVHEQLYQSADMARVEFAGYARTLLDYLWRAHGAAASRVRLSLDLEPVSLAVNAAVPCGLILNELVSNALKHGFCGRASGEVAVSVRAGPGGGMCLRVRDNGVGFPPDLDWRRARSLGLRLVQMLAGQLHATVEVESRQGEGTEFLVAFGSGEHT